MKLIYLSLAASVVNVVLLGAVFFVGQKEQPDLTASLQQVADYTAQAYNIASSTVGVVQTHDVALFKVICQTKTPDIIDLSKCSQ